MLSPSWHTVDCSVQQTFTVYTVTMGTGVTKSMGAVGWMRWIPGTGLLQPITDTSTASLQMIQYPWGLEQLQLSR